MGSALYAQRADDLTTMKPAPDGWPDPCRRGFRGRKRLRTLGAIVHDYIRRHRHKTIRELRYFRSLQSLDDAIAKAGLARRPDGKRWSHQRRIPSAALDAATRRLRQAHLQSARSFADLIERVDTAVRLVRGIGELYVYDTALRLGAHLRLLPHAVYLHAGTRRGARALGLDHRSDSIAPSQLPAAFQRLRPHEVEDVLCIYKDWLRKANGA